MYIFKSYTVIYAGRCTPICYLPKCGPRTSPEKRAWPFEIKSFESYVLVYILKFVKTRDMTQVITFLAYTNIFEYQRDINDVD